MSSQEAQIDEMRVDNPLLDSDTARRILTSVKPGDAQNQALRRSADTNVQNPMFSSASTSALPAQPQAPSRLFPPNQHQHRHTTSDSGNITMSPLSTSEHTDSRTPPPVPKRTSLRRMTADYSRTNDSAKHIAEQRKRCAQMEGALLVYDQQFQTIAQDVKRAQIQLSTLSMENGNRRITHDDLYDVQADILQHEERLKQLSDILREERTGRVAPPVPPRPMYIDPSQRPLRSPNPENPGAYEKWSCSKCTFLNHFQLNHCEMCDSLRADVTVVEVPGSPDYPPSTSASPMDTSPSEQPRLRRPNNLNTRAMSTETKPHRHQAGGSFSCYCCEPPQGEGQAADQKDSGCSTSTTPTSDQWELVDAAAATPSPSTRHGSVPSPSTGRGRHRKQSADKKSRRSHLHRFLSNMTNGTPTQPTNSSQTPSSLDNSTNNSLDRRNGKPRTALKMHSSQSVDQ